MGCEVLVMRKSTRAHWVEPLNELTMPQKSSNLGGGDKSNCETGVALTGTIACDVFVSLVVIPGRHAC